MQIIRSFLLFVFPVYFLSCGTQHRVPNYIQNITDSTEKKSFQVPELRIQKNDLLSIQVYSASVRPEADAPYNLPVASGAASAQTSPTSGFLVDNKGEIQYPRLGTFHVEGLTKEQLAAEIKKRLTEPVILLDDPRVIVRFLNLKVTIMGEVNNQGVVSIPGERVTILEAIGLVGGLTDYAQKTTVKIIRETDGQREVGFVDLSSDKVFESSYYNLQQNDLVLIDPDPRKAKLAEQNVVIQRVGFGLSILTAIALLYNIFQ